ncbi:MAG: cyclic peptide export ABC transporter [Pseudomonadota bacterium]
MLSLFTSRAPNRVFIAMLLGIAAGFGVAMVIPLLMNIVQPTPGGFSPQASDSLFLGNWEVSDARFAVTFVVLCALTFIARTVAQVLLIRVSATVTTDLRARIYNVVARAPLAAVESVGPSRLMAVLTADVPRIVGGARLVPEVLTSAMTLLGLFGFLYYLNAEVAAFVLLAIGIGVVTYQVPVFIGRRYLARSRHHLDSLHEGIRGLVYGVKELKLNRLRRDAFLDEVLMDSERKVRQAQKTGQSVLRVAMNYGNLIGFFVIGAVSFIVINHTTLTRAELVGVIMVLLYVSGPVGMLLSFVPQLMSAGISYRKLKQLLSALPSEGVSDKVIEPMSWQTLEFTDVTYVHKDASGEAAFKLGPVSFTLERGSVTFIVGGNGSGKSTLSKLISLHYRPDGGKIHFDSVRVDEQTITTFRQKISVIYSDYYLFAKLLMVRSSKATAKVNHYLKMLELDHKVSFDGSAFSTLKLSDGQRRRLALLVSFIEDSDLYLFDEWAADQDPRFKVVFYTEILPELKARGKAVVVISHDDRYFDVADRLIHMEDGRIRSISKATASKSNVLPIGTTPRVVL